MSPPVRHAPAANHPCSQLSAANPIRRLLQTILPVLFFCAVLLPLRAQNLPASNITLNFGNVIAGVPSVQWFKVAQAYPSLTVSTTPGSAFGVILIEDIGFGHGQPPSAAFSFTFTGSCFNCWLGVQFIPHSSGPQTATLTIPFPNTFTPYVLTLNGEGTPSTGLLLTPVAQDFGAIAVNSSSSPALFTLTNLVASGNSVTVAAPSVTGDFVLSTSPGGGATCAGPLAYTASCFVAISFAPTSTGLHTGSLTVQSSSGTASAALTGVGVADPGVALNPSALVFNAVPGLAATQQSITLTNTTSSPEQIGQPSVSAAGFIALTNCATLAPAASCSVAVTFTPATAPATAILRIPVTSLNGSATLTASLTGAYTINNGGLEITPADPQYSPQPGGVLSPSRQFTVTNLTAKYAALTFDLPRQFVFTGLPCATLAPNASCTFFLSFLPLTNADITGTIFAHATPADGSAILNGTAYVEGYGLATGDLSISGPLQPGAVLNFGQLASGKSAQRTITLTNSSTAAPLTIRRITSLWPFLATNTCGTTLAPAANCTVTLTYTPSNQVTAAANPPPTTTDTHLLVIESDSASSPDLINLTGNSTPVIVVSPSNAAAQPILSLSTSSLTFVSTTPGATSPTQTVLLTNIGAASLNLSGILSSTPDFAVANNCSTVAPGASCTLAVSFTPQNSSIPSTRVGAVEISSNASTPLEFISLIGTAAPAGSAPLASSPAALAFGSVLVGASSTLSLQLTNPGTAAATSLAYATTGDYMVASGTCPSPANALSAGATCTLQITFTPTLTGLRTGTLWIASSATSPPLTVPLTGTGYLAGSFALTVDGAATASATVKAGSSATYALGLTPLNNFTGSVSLACRPIAPAVNATCIVSPSSVTLAGSMQTAVATITTVTATGRSPAPALRGRELTGAAILCLIVPAIFLPVKSRTTRRRNVLWVLAASLALVSASACGGSHVIPIPNRDAAPGNYQYQVTATSGAISQAVTLNLIVQ
jgi:hypothetical protein